MKPVLLFAVLSLLSAATGFHPPTRTPVLRALSASAAGINARVAIARQRQDAIAKLCSVNQIQQHQQWQKRWRKPLARAARWLPRILACFATVLLPRLLLAATTDIGGASASWKPTKLGRLPTAAEMEGYLVPFFAKFFGSNNMVLRYGSIPLVAGLLNWATNRLAILMMFYPLRFRGLGRVGWQGIVPGKKISMANRIVDDVMLRLIDLRTVFARLPPEAIAEALEPTILKVGQGLATDLIERKGARRD